MFCQKCGRELAWNDRKCPGCGERVRASRRQRKAARRAAASGVEITRAEASSLAALGYEKMFYNGTCRIEEGVYSRCVEFDDANFQAAKQADQDDFFNRYATMLNSFDAEVRMQVLILMHVIPEEQFRHEMYMPMVEGDERGNALRREINDIIDSRVSETRQNIRRRRFIVLRTGAATKEKAEPVLARACQTAIDQLRLLGVGARELSGTERLEVMCAVSNPKDGAGRVSYKDLEALPGLTTADLVAPTSFERNADPSTACSWSGVFGQALYMQKWSTSVRADMLSKITELPLNVAITIDYRGWDQAKARETVETYLTDTKVQKSDYIQKHSQRMFITDEMLPSDLRDAIANAELLRGDLFDRQQKYWSVAMTVLAWGDTPDERDLFVEEIQSVARMFNCRLAPLACLQMQGFQAALGTGASRIPDEYRMNMCTAPAAALMPFTSVELMEPGGMYMGQNRISKNFIFYDRKAATSPNGFILGKPGRGKSVNAKYFIENVLLSDPDADVIVIDPEREYLGTAREFAGEVVDVSASSGTYINPFDLEVESDEAQPLAMKTDAIISMVEQMAKNLTELQKTLVDRSVTIAYERFFETKDPADIPTLVEFHDILKGQPEDEGALLATTIERYISGQANLFSHRTNVDTSSRFVVYDVRDLADNMKGLALLILLDATWQRIVRNRERHVRTWVFIDEMQLLLSNGYAVDYFDMLWTRSRKYGAIPTGITQNVERLVNNEKTRLMLANSDFLLLLGQSATDAMALGEVLSLSDEQVGYIRNSGVGEGLLVANGKVIPFENRIPTDTQLYRITTTKIDDLAAMDEAAHGGGEPLGTRKEA